MRRSGFLVGALVLLSAAWAAAGDKPHIEKIENDLPMAGSVVKIVGTNFSDKKADISVMIDGSLPADILLPTVEALTVALPSPLSKGKHKLHVTIGKERSNEFEIVIHGEEDRQDKIKRDIERHEGTSGDPTVKKHLILDPPSAAADRGALVITVPGKADYPDGALILLELKLDAKLITSMQTEVHAGALKGRFECNKQLFAGNYWVDGWFELSRQPGAIRLAFREAIKDPVKQQEFASAHDRQFVRVGSVADEQWQIKELKGYFQATLARSRDLLKELETNFAAAGRSIFRAKDGKVDEAAWEDWVKKHSKSISTEVYEARLREAKAATPFLNKDNSLNDQAWREWLDFKWREEGILKMVKDHVSYKDKYLAPKNEDELNEVEKLFSTLLRLSQTRSLDLYKENGMPPSEKDSQGAGTQALGIAAAGGPASPANVEMCAHRIEMVLEKPPFKEPENK